MIKQAYVRHCPGHINSKGLKAEWCIFSHDDDKILSSHLSEEAAKEHLKDMEIHKDKKSEAAPENFKWFKNIDALLANNCTNTS